MPLSRGIAFSCTFRLPSYDRRFLRRLEHCGEHVVSEFGGLDRGVRPKPVLVPAIKITLFMTVLLVIASLMKLDRLSTNQLVRKS